MERFGKFVSAGVVLGFFVTTVPVNADPLIIKMPVAVGTLTQVEGSTDVSVSGGTFVSSTDGTVRSAVLEYDISDLVNVRWSTLESVIAQEPVNTGVRTVAGFSFIGDGHVDAGDLVAPATFLGRFSFQPGLDPSTGGFFFALNAKHQLRAAVAQGATFFGVRIVPVNDQPVSRLTNIGANGDFPLLVVNPAPVPEPSSLILLGTGAAALLIRARRRRQQLPN